MKEKAREKREELRKQMRDDLKKKVKAMLYREERRIMKLKRLASMCLSLNARNN